MPFPFEMPFEEVEANLDNYVNEVFSCLESEFLLLPKGAGFVEYPVFERGYEALKKETSNLSDFKPEAVIEAVYNFPVAFIVLRCMLGFTPPEWAYIATQQTGVNIPQGSARTIDRNIRMNPDAPIPPRGSTALRISALVTTACNLLSEGAPEVDSDKIHRLDKADSTEGLVSLQSLANLGIPYPVLLYERLLGRPFAGHRDSVSELVGDLLEIAIEETLNKARVSFRKTKRAERIQGFDQAPDFIVPNEFNPKIVIEAKLTEDDGTARDKVTRVQHLGEMSLEGQPAGQPKFEVVACIAGRGFGVRREDMKKLLRATRGKVFTSQNIAQLVEYTRIREYQTR